MAASGGGRKGEAPHGGGRGGAARTPRALRCGGYEHDGRGSGIAKGKQTFHCRKCGFSLCRERHEYRLALDRLEGSEVSRLPLTASSRGGEHRVLRRSHARGWQLRGAHGPQGGGLLALAGNVR